MAPKLIGVILLTLTFNSWGKFLALDKIVYTPLNNVDDIYFTVKSKEFDKLIKEKLLLDKNPEMTFHIFKQENSLDVDIKGHEFSSAPLEQSIKRIVLDKANHIWQDRLSEYLDVLKFTEKSGDWHLYEDETGLLEIRSLRLRFTNNNLMLVLERNESREEIKYTYKRRPWSSSKIVLSSIESVLKENGQVYIQKLIYSYEKVSKGIWLPVKLEVITEHRKMSDNPDENHRLLSEVYLFNNYKFDQKFATNWFKSKI